MTSRFPATSLIFVIAVAVSGHAPAQEKLGHEKAGAGTPVVDDKTTATTGEPSDAAKTDDREKAAKLNQPQVATFGGGCFWCTEAVCQRVPGVISVVSGYSGGNVPNPTYEAVSSGMTGHAEAVQVVFNPRILSYQKLIEVFFRSHDPTTPNAQGPDVGTQYRSVIFYHNNEQRQAALEVYKNLKARKVLRGTVVTELVPFRAFFPAEPYHQNYYNNHPDDPYSLVYIEPKFDVFRKMMKGTSKAAPKGAHGAAKAKGRTQGASKSSAVGKLKMTLKPAAGDASKSEAEPKKP